MTTITTTFTAAAPCDFGTVPVGETQFRQVVLTVAGGVVVIGRRSAVTGPFSSLGPIAVAAPLTVWVTFTPTASALQNGSVTFEFTDTTAAVIPVTVPTRGTGSGSLSPRAVSLVLDRSGSMGTDISPGFTRMQALKPAARQFVDLLRADDQLALVPFSTAADVPVLAALAPVGPVSGQTRTTLKGQINALTPDGSTSIGDGIGAGNGQLSGPTVPVEKRIVVFTDGEQNTPPDIPGSLATPDLRVYAVGLGTANVLNPSALRALCLHQHGDMLITGPVDDPEDLTLQKYFLQVLAQASSSSVVVDPATRLQPGESWDVPFTVTEFDREFTVITLSPVPGELDLALRTPAGQTIAWTDQVAGVIAVKTDTMAFFRVSVPVADRGDAHAGPWQLMVSRQGGIINLRADGEEDPEKGLLVDVSVHAQSSIGMDVRVRQTAVEPGATVDLEAVLTLGSAAWRFPAEVRAEIAAPDGKLDLRTLSETDGVYGTSFVAGVAGVYTVKITADGLTDVTLDPSGTASGLPFTRFETRTVAVYQPRTTPLPVPGETIPPGQGLPGCLAAIWAWLKKLLRLSK
jgi:hypothetical protein